MTTSEFIGTFYYLQLAKWLEKLNNKSNKLEKEIDWRWERTRKQDHIEVTGLSLKLSVFLSSRGSDVSF